MSFSKIESIRRLLALFSLHCFCSGIHSLELFWLLAIDFGSLQNFLKTVLLFQLYILYVCYHGSTSLAPQNMRIICALFALKGCLHNTVFSLMCSPCKRFTEITQAIIIIILLKSEPGQQHTHTQAHKSTMQIIQIKQL